MELQGYTEDGQPGLIMLLAHPTGILVFDGMSLPIHRLNDEFPPDLSTTAGRESYLQIFLNMVWGEDGRFQPIDNVFLLASRLTPAEKADQWATELRPLTSAGDAQDDGSFLAEGTILYGNALFEVEMKLAPGGLVDMLRDEPRSRDLATIREYYHGPMVVRMVDGDRATDAHPA